ncbi:MAG: hypothetical protein SWK90_11430 [Chloroflexota bacterium]|nr:hypothetical protein [Chloroflexota bacterium]
MSVKARVKKLEQARPADKRERGRRFAESLSRAYGDGEPVEPIPDEQFESALRRAYGPDYRPPSQ